jgi:hypothetical protein
MAHRRDAFYFLPRYPARCLRRCFSRAAPHFLFVSKLARRAGWRVTGQDKDTHDQASQYRSSDHSSDPVSGGLRQFVGVATRA